MNQQIERSDRHRSPELEGGGPLQRSPEFRGPVEEVEMSASRIEYDDRRCLLAIVRDISERKSASAPSGDCTKSRRIRT